MRAAENFCLFLNRFFPKRKIEGTESPQAYSEAEYNWAQGSYRYYTNYVDVVGKKVLDAGCGLGGKTVYYAEKGCALVTGIDIDEKKIGFANEFAAKKKVTNGEFIVGSLAAMPFEDNSYDIIFLNDVVEHIDRPILIKALEECKRVIKPGGKICLEFPPWTSFEAAHLYHYIHIPWCQVLFSDKTLINVMNKLAPEQGTVGGTLSYIEHFKELNRITIKEFKEIVRNLDFKVINIDQVIPLGMNFLKYIPVVNKYATLRVVGVLSKKS